MEPPQASTRAAAKALEDWQKHFDAPRESTGIVLPSILRRHYPDWTVTVTPSATGLIPFAAAGLAEAEFDFSDDLYNSSRVYRPPRSRLSREPGKLKDKTTFGKYHYTWREHSFILYIAEYYENWGRASTLFILSKREPTSLPGPAPKHVDELIAAAATWSNELYDEILVFDQQEWLKDEELYKAVQSASWDDLILNKEMKESLVKDVEGFFDCRDDYKEFSVPWKRGIIFHGTPGNGKTISIKALMHSLASRPDPIPTLYVKSLAGCNNSFYAIREIFVQARQYAPCLLVFEDLDSLISDQVKSFFLNEVDGLEDNNGIMMIGSTNYLERLDAGISKRPSRFDRKYHFALPATPERIEYCHFWRAKLAKNKNIDFPEPLSAAIADLTEGFSFAYLKETFVTALLVIVAAQRGGSSSKEIENLPEAKTETNGGASSGGGGGQFEHVLLWRVIRKQVQTLRAEMEDARKSAEEAAENNDSSAASASKSSHASANRTRMQQEKYVRRMRALRTGDY